MRTTSYLLTVLALLSTLAGCSRPPAAAFIGGGGRDAEGFDIGANTAQEACLVSRGGTNSTIYCGANLDPAGHVLGPRPETDLGAFVTSSGWRTALDQRFVCGPPAAVRVLDTDGVMLSCTRRQSGWPHAVIAARMGDGLYVADGIRSLGPVLPRAIGVLSGKLTETPVTAAAQSEVATRRQAARAENAEGAEALGQVESLMSKGAQENRRGNYAASEAAYRAAIAIQQRVAGLDNPALAVPLARQALQMSNQGRFTEAEPLLARADRLANAPNQLDPVAAPLTAHLRALNQINRKKPEAALPLLDTAERGFRKTVPPDALVTRASANRPASGAERLAATAADKALVSDPSVSEALYGLIETRRYRALALRALGRTLEAQAALDDARNLYLNRGARIVARYYRTVGSTLAAAGQGDAAVSEFDRSVNAFARGQPGSRPLAETQLLQASQLVDQGSLGAAVSVCREATSVLLALKIGASINQVVPCLRALAADAVGDGSGAQATRAEMFAVAQLAQGNITSRQIAIATARLAESARDPRVGDAIKQRDKASETLDALYRKRAFLADDKDSAKEVERLDQQIRDAREKREEAGQALQAASPGFSALVQESITLDQARAALHPNEALATIVLGDKEGWTVLLRADRVEIGRVDGGSSKIDPLVKRFRAGMEPGPDNRPPPFDAAAAKELYDLVLGPVADGLTGLDALTVAPSGTLLSVPFGALLTGTAVAGAPSKSPFLIRKMAISHVPSAASFVNLRKATATVQATRPWFGMGDFRPPSLVQARRTFPDERCGESARLLAGLSTLPGARRELEVARQLLGVDSNEQLLGPAFTSSAVRAAPLSNYRMLHFATHAMLPGELRCQEEPAVLTSTQGDAPDASGAFLTASQIGDMKLDAELVILAACNTGGANVGGAGESLSGLARSFFFAGARALLVTHWEANDRTTTYLTALFLNNLKGDPGAGPAAALALAQRRMLDEAAGEQTALGHPYYWAVSALIGGRGIGDSAKVADTRVGQERG